MAEAVAGGDTGLRAGCGSEGTASSVCCPECHAGGDGSGCAVDGFLLGGGVNGGFSGPGSRLEDRACLGFVFFSDGGSGGGGLGVGVWGGVVWVYCDGGCDAEEGEGGGEDFFHWFCLCFVGVFFSLIVVRM